MRARPSTRDTTAVTRPRLSVSISGDIDERERDLDHALEVVDGDAFVRRVDVLHAVREIQAGETALVEYVGIGGAAAEAVTRREAGSLERRMGDPDDGVVTLESVTAIALRHLRLHFAILEAGREGEGVDHLLDEIGELAFVMR